ncbi:hypothetical protein BBJ28_00025331 [Nothophytophthora sp. Chile5]|nr:hypothetical protein BBJ28_00025331 [Nothophytophthora sp. Chile5]
MKSEMQMPINAKMIVHSVVELYDSTKREIANILRSNRIRPASSFAVVADFWSCKVTKDKFLGLRLYLVDEAFTFRSFLLGTRHFKPGYEEREGGIRAPFRSWIKAILADFDVAESDLFGATTDGDPDVKHMMQETLGLQWEWCIPHLTNAATKMACGESSGLDNPDMQELVTKLKRTVFSTNAVEVVGSLFTDLCSVLNPGSKAKNLLQFEAHRFMGLTRVIARALEKWEVLVSWYEERRNKSFRDNEEPDSFPLDGHKLDLEHLLSLFNPITILNRKSQAEDANQVETNFFSRYTDQAKITQRPFIFECQMMLHPRLKNLETLSNVARISNQHLGRQFADANRIAGEVCQQVKRHVREIMLSVVSEQGHDQQATQPEPQPEHFQFASAPTSVFSEELSDLYEAAPVIDPVVAREDPVDAELRKWMTDTSTLTAKPDGTCETLLEFWRRQKESHSYCIIPKAVRLLFSVPTSSAQIERDFGVSGMMVASLRGSTAPHNVDMCSFLNRNRKIVDVCQTPKIAKADIESHIPSNVVVTLDNDNLAHFLASFDTDFSAMENQFSQTSIETENM